MGNQKQKWTAEEEEALMAGVVKHGAGKWKNILVDSEFAPKLSSRSNVDLKDKWRNMGASHGQGCRDNSTTIKEKGTSSSAVAAPNTQTSTSVLSSKEKINDNPTESSQDAKNGTKYNTMILEAISSLKDPNGSDIGAIVGFIENKYEVPHNFRRLLSSKLRRLVLQGKLEKVPHGYKIRDDAELGTKTPALTERDVRPKPSQPSSSTISGDSVEDAATLAARWVAEAENKAFVTAEAVKESERVAQLAEEQLAMLKLSEELLAECSKDGYIILNYT